MRPQTSYKHLRKDDKIRCIKFNSCVIYSINFPRGRRNASMFFFKIFQGTGNVVMMMRLGGNMKQVFQVVSMCCLFFHICCRVF